MSLDRLAAQIAFITGITAFAVPVFATQAQDLTNFETCVMSASGPQWSATTQTCTLPYYSSPYLISSQITISSSAVRYISTGSGGTASTYPQATLQRDISSFSGTPSPFAILYATSATNNLLIESLIINGNRTGKNLNGNAVLQCLTTATGVNSWIDVDLGGAGYSGSATWPGVSVYDVTFNNAPGFALNLGQESYVYYSWFYYPRRSAVYTSANSAVNYSTMEYTGVEAVALSGNNVLVEYNTLFQDQDEWIFGDSGGQLFVSTSASSNFTFLSNVVNGNNAYCLPGVVCNVPYGCTGSGCWCSFTPAGTMYNDGIEVHMGGGTYNNNQLENSKGNGLLLSSVDGSGITAVTGWHSLSSTTARQAVTLLNDDPNWTLQEIEGNGSDGVTMIYGSPYDFGGAFSFTDLRSFNNTPALASNDYGFEWISPTSAIKSGTTLSWGTANAACLTGNANGPIGQMPSGFSGPSSTSHCP